ncbi:MULTISPECIES: hypothetical protein [Clostridium]|uniref:Uncharacterized protein n=1 Tax=Clostridium frigoriphilum TaxID=443253 RepID=A0ABU7UI33_9CLOT|nr:hypothetical protein [Clostridium sp. DSM 17811]
MKNKVRVFKGKLRAIKLIFKADVMVITNDNYGGTQINVKIN